MTTKILTRIIITTSVLIFLFWHPVTRRIMFVILPLGRSWDDIIFWILAITLILAAFVKGWISIPKLFKKGEN